MPPKGLNAETTADTAATIRAHLERHPTVDALHLPNVPAMRPRDGRLQWQRLACVRALRVLRLSYGQHTVTP
jgi:hypothetical protein